MHGGERTLGCGVTSFDGAVHIEVRSLLPDCGDIDPKLDHEHWHGC